MNTLPQNRLRELRKRQGLLQSQVADSIGVDRSQISYWETGKAKLGIPEHIKFLLANELKVSVPYLMGYDRRNGREVAA